MDYKGQNLEFVENLSGSERTATMVLFGEISSNHGESFINGDSFAKELIFLAEHGIKHIKIPINSVGGSIRQGMSIITAMNVARMNGASIETFVIGVADSMSGMISAFGDKGKRNIANFGSGIIHEPLIRDNEGNQVKIEDVQDPELKSEMIAMKDTLVTLMISSTGQTRSEISRVMKEGKRLNAGQMKDFGMVDNIIKLSNESIETENMTAVDLMVACSNINTIKNDNINKMKNVNKILNLSNDASESSSVSAIEAIQNTVAENVITIGKKDAEILKLKGENEVLVNSAKETADATATSYVDALINAGKLNKENRDALVNSAKENFVGFKTLTESLQVTFVDVTKEIANAGVTDKTEVLAKEFYNLRQDGVAYEAMKNDNPTKFNKLEDAFLNSSTDFDAIQ